MANIHMCDKCNKVIDKDLFSISYGKRVFSSSNHSELCEECAKPLKEYLYHFFNN